MNKFSLPDLLRRGARSSVPPQLDASRLARIPSAQELRASLDLELRRCRRYQHPLTLMLVAPSNSIAHSNGNQSVVAHDPEWFAYSEQLGFLLLGSLLRGMLRESDVVGYLADGHEFAAFLPESDRAAALSALQRVHRLFHERTSLGLRAALASFPTDGLTVQDLIDRARSATTESAFMSAAPAWLSKNGNSHE